MPRVSVSIDPHRLKDALRKRNEFNMERVSLKLGRSKPYMNNIIKKAKMDKSTAVLLEAVYGIKFEEYKPLVDTIKPAVVEKPSGCMFTRSQLIKMLEDEEVRAILVDIIKEAFE